MPRGIYKRVKPAWNKGTKGLIKVNSGSFQKGQTSWNKGKRTGKEMPCVYCGKMKYYLPDKVKTKTGKHYCSSKHQQLDQVWENNPSWKKDDNISYVQIHRRVRSKRGVPENYPCAMQDKTCKGMLEWASISHKANTDIEDFIPLCRSHHRRYDLRNKK